MHASVLKFRYVTRKPVFRDMQPSKLRTGLLSFKLARVLKFLVNIYKYCTIQTFEVLENDRKKLGMDSADPQNRSEWRGRLRERLVKKPNPR